MDKIRIARNVRRIEVNDDGEYIELDFNDQSLPHRFLAVFNDIGAKKREFDKRIATDSDINLVSTVELEYEVNIYFKSKIDELFGKDTCRKVYGDILPSIEMHIDFLSQLIPYFEEYAASRREKMNKYNSGRGGSV